MSKSKRIFIAYLGVSTILVCSICVSVTAALLESVDSVNQPATQKRVLYVNVEDSEYWQDYSGQKIAAYVWAVDNSEVSAGFLNGSFMERLGEEPYYFVTIPQNVYSHIIFAKCNVNATMPSFDDDVRFNQTIDLEIPTDKDCFRLDRYDGGNRKQWNGEWEVKANYTYIYTS